MSTESPTLLMRSTVRIEVTEGRDKIVHLPTEESPVRMGLHDELAAHFGLEHGSYVPHASTLDYLIGAVAACLAGTFKGALAARGVFVDPDDLRVEAVGEIAMQEGVPVVRSIVVSYRLSGTDDEQHDVITRAHAVHHRACAASRSIEASVEIRTELELV
jgi:uncharacterized OsmC-like protein